MTTDEIEIVDLLGEAWNKFIALPKQHEDDNREFCDAIHRAQYLVMKRTAVRLLRQPAIETGKTPPEG